MSVASDPLNKPDANLNGEMFAQIVAAAAVPIISMSTDGVIRSWNPAAETLLGYAASEAIGRAIVELTADGARNAHVFDDIRDLRAPPTRDLGLRHKSGALVSVEASVSPILDDDGDVKAIALVLHDFRHRKGEHMPPEETLHDDDLSPQKRTEIALRETEARLRRFYDSRLMGVIYWTMQGQILDANDMFLEMIGYTRDELRAGLVDWQNLTPPEYRLLDEQSIAEITTFGENLAPFEKEYIRKDGSRVPIILAGALLGDGSDNGVAFVIDITERKRHEDALRDNEQRMRLATETTGVGVWEWNVITNQVRWDAQMFRLYGLEPTPDGVIRYETWSMRVVPSELAEQEADLRALILNGGVGSREFTILRADDQRPRRIRTVETVRRNPVGHVEWVIGTNLDVTEAYDAARALEESQERLARALQAAEAGAWEVTLATGAFWASEKALAIHGFPPGVQITREMATACIHPEDRDRVEAAMQKAIDEGTPFRIEMRIIWPDGAVRWVSSSADVKQGPNHPRLVGLVMDITERRRQDEALRAAHDTFRNVVERSPFGVYTIDADFRIVHVSLGAQKVFENVRPLIGRNLEDALRIIWPEPYVSDILRRFRHTLNSGEPFVASNWSEQRADIDATQAYDWRIERITMPDGRYGVMCNFYDLSERKRHEEQVHLLMAEVNHRAKNMLGLVQAIARQTAAKGRRDFLKRFDERLQALAASQDVLVKSNWSAVDLVDLVHSQLAHFGNLIATRITVIGPTVHITAKASQTLSMALHELATNATKYGALSNATGRVEIMWDVVTTAAGLQRFTMAWRETDGPRVASPSRHGFGSTVIGVMVKMGLNCEVDVQYAPPGFLWRIDCPAERVLERSANASSPSLASGAKPASTPARKRVLVVEDEVLIALELAETLSEAGFEVVGPAGSVAQAMTLIDHPGCDLAVLDSNLGVETAEPIAIGLRHAHIPFLSVSGYSRDQQPPALRDAPMLSKPLRPGELVTQVRRLLAS